VGKSDTALLPLAESVADGSSVDWHEAEARATTDEQSVIRQLRVLASLAAIHRSLPAASDAGPHAGDRRTSSPAIGNWAELSLIERLGGGTFGEVYRAWDRHLEREVALKLLRLDDLHDDPQTSRIAREGRLLARIRHPNVITVHGVEIHEGRVGLCMELVRGTTLEDVLRKRGSFSAREAALVGIDLCRALAAVHGAGLIHRDVKAQNVMREDGGRIVLMDLGTGRDTRPDGAFGVPDLAGTPLYLAPEIFDGAAASERTDLYSLGVLLYHLVTGSFPVPAATVDELRDAQARGAVVRLRDARADLPTMFVQVVDRAISRDPQGRYTTAGALEADLLEALRETADIQPLNTPGEAAVRRPLTWFRRGPLSAPAAAVLALTAAAVVGYFSWNLAYRPVPLAARAIRSIAVLPLANMSGDASQDFFADGMTDVLISNLARIRALRVISRTSAMQYKGVHAPMKDVARALNVDAILEGSVVRAGDRVRIAVDLVQVATDRHVWAESYERDVRDVLALQSEVARAIAGEVQAQLTPQEEASFAAAAAAPQLNSAAQDAYLQGRYYWSKRTPDGLQQALDYFRRASALAPNFAPAYAGQADTYNLLPGNMPPAVAYPLAKAAAAKALELDPTLAEAHTSLAFATFIFDRDWSSAEAAFQRALQFNPSYPTAHLWYGDFLQAQGRFAEASARFEQAAALDPLSPAIAVEIGAAPLYEGRYDEAIRRLRAALQRHPGTPGAHYYLAVCYELKGMLAEAATETRRGLEVAADGRIHELLVSETGRLASLEGRRDDALKVIRDLAALPSDGFVQMTIAYVHAALGNADRMFEALQRAEAERSPGLLWLASSPLFITYRTDPRFIRLLGQIQLPH
jgi:TolB-like protein/tRNA A-37 threonylcarbamoyl transferase component Bud32/Flp pilus assembly protein TadD